ncbi:Uncharacterised protein [Yersinia frederiksenii]|nr:Uncharacterised protein [Yersinia frederiksenii]
MVVAVTAPSATCSPVPALSVTLMSKYALLRSTPPTELIPVPAPVTLIILLPLTLLANVRPAKLFSAVPVTVLKMIWFNARLTPAAFEKATPVPFRFRIKSVKTWLLLVPAKVNAFAAPVVVIAPPTIFSNALVRTLIPVPALALTVPPVLSILIVCAVAAETAIPAVVLVIEPLLVKLAVPLPLWVRTIPAVVLLIVPALVTLIVPLPVSVTLIPVAFLIVPSTSLRTTTLPDEAALILIPVPAVVFCVPSEMVAAERI